MGPRLRWEDCVKRDVSIGGRGGRLEEEDKKQRRVEKTIRWGDEEVAGSTSPPPKGKRGRERERERELVKGRIISQVEC